MDLFANKPLVRSNQVVRCKVIIEPVESMEVIEPDIFKYYEEREANTAILAEEQIELQQEVDEEETALDESKVTWSNLRVNDNRCKIITGFTPDEFLTIYNLVQEVITEHTGRGQKSKISKQDKLVMTLCYLKHYETLDKMRDTFFISKAYLCTVLNDTIKVITPVLYDYYVDMIGERVTNADGKNPAENKLFPEAHFVMDVTIQPIWTPIGTYNEKKVYFSGKHKIYGLKSQCIHDRKGRVVNCVAGEPGSYHDLSICKENINLLKAVLLKESDNSDEESDEYWSVLVDSGYQGLQTLIETAILPHKKQAKKRLPQTQKKFNKELASQRVACERFYGRLKTKWRIMSSKYRSSREEYKQVFELCVALTNYDLILHPL